MANLTDEYYSEAARLYIAGKAQGLRMVVVFDFEPSATRDDVYAAMRAVGDDHMVSRLGVSHTDPAKEHDFTQLMERRPTPPI